MTLLNLFKRSIPANTDIRKLLIEIIQSDSTIIASCINPHSCAVSLRNKDFKCALENSDIIIPDGIGIEIASKVFKNVNIKRITGNSLFFEMMDVLNEKAGRVFFLGTNELTNKKIETRCSHEYPNIQIVGMIAPRYCESFSRNEIKKFVDEINKANADVLYIGLSAPKQEILANRLFEQGLKVKYCQSIGAMFDHYASGQSRSNYNLISRLKIEWLWRLINNPRRLWKRTFISLPIFLSVVLWEASNAIFDKDK